MVAVKRLVEVRAARKAVAAQIGIITYDLGQPLCQAFTSFALDLLNTRQARVGFSPPRNE